MATAGVSAAAGVSADVGRNQFLKLMVAQLRAQDPLEPIKDQEFTAQLAQFSMLEGIEKLNTNFGDMLALQQVTQGAGLLGKTVTFTNNGTTETGSVEGFTVVDGRLNLRVSGQEIPIGNIRGMTEQAA